jgi:hypothetical protein
MKSVFPHSLFTIHQLESAPHQDLLRLLPSKLRRRNPLYSHVADPISQSAPATNTGANGQDQSFESQTTQFQSQSPPPAHAPLQRDVITTSPDHAVLILCEQFRAIDQRKGFHNALETVIQAFSPAPQDVGETIDEVDGTPSSSNEDEKDINLKNIQEVLIRLENLKPERAVSKISCAFLSSAFHMINLGLDEFIERDVFDNKFENLVRLTQAFSDVRRRKRFRERNIVVCEIELEEP